MIRSLSTTDDLLSLVIRWAQEWNAASFGLTADPLKVAIGLFSLQHQGGTCLVMERDGQIVGFMGVKPFVNPYGHEKIAEEHCWYVLPEYRTHAWLFVRKAHGWAKENGCSHLILTASYMASDRCERVSQLYEKMGLTPFERVHIGRV